MKQTITKEMLNKCVNKLESKFNVIYNELEAIYAALAKGNYIPDRHLFRRWVMAQMFHMLKDGDFTKELIEDNGIDINAKIASWRKK